MKNLLATLIVVIAFASQAADEPPSVAAGIVESVREVPLDIHGFREALEHSVNPQTAQQLVIRLDDERAVTLLEEGMQRFAPGERVRIVSGLVERE
jgi:outer membrane lipoprotein SlyB